MWNFTFKWRSNKCTCSLFSLIFRNVSKISKKRSIQHVYGWGYANTGALGIPELLLTGNRCKVFYPYNIAYFKKNKLKVQAAAAGCGFSVFVTRGTSGSLLGTGINTDSQLGYQMLEDRVCSYICQPVGIDLSSLSNSDIIDVAAGRAHTLILTSDHNAFSFGNNAYGQCGRPVIPDERYSGSNVVHHIDIGEKVRSVFAGQDHSMLLSESGRIFSFGISTDGQLGRPCKRGFDETPAPVEGALSGVRVSTVSCRSDTALALSEDGILYGWGNNEYSQLKALSESDTQLFEPCEILVKNGKSRVTSCASGSTSCIAIDSSGEVYSWGFGALGRGPSEVHSPVPKQIPSSLFGKNDFGQISRPSSAFSGIGFFFVTTETGELYAWGRNKFGTCGVGVKESDQFFPLKATYRAVHQLNDRGHTASKFVKIIRQFVSKFHPYIELTRIDRPVGIYLLFLPTAWGTALAATPGSLPNFQLMLLFLLGATLMRSAGCIINDIWDRRFDSQVERTKLRPIAAGVIKPSTALALASILSVSAAGLVLLPLNHHAQIVSLCSIPLVIAYPAAKRVFGWPQLVLGVTFNWGVLVGYVAATCDGNILSPLAPVALLYSSAVCWTLFYDTLYAYQDYDDDVKIGIHSTAITWGRGKSGRRYLYGTGAAFLSLLSGSLWFAAIEHSILTLGLLASCGHLAWQLKLAGSLDNRYGECGRAFKSNTTLGVIVLSTIILGRWFQ